MTSTTPARLITAANCGQHSTNDELKALAKGMIRECPLDLVVVSTKFIGPTNTKGSRIKATLNGTTVTKTVGLDYSLNELEMHAYAAFYLLSTWFEGEQLQYWGYDGTADGKGYNFVYRFV